MSSPAGSRQRVHAIRYAGARLYCIGTDSVVRWRRTIGGSNYCSPAVDADGNVYVGSANATGSTFYCIGPDSTVSDSHVIGDDIWSSPPLVKMTHYVGSMNDHYTSPGSGSCGGRVKARSRTCQHPTAAESDSRGRADCALRPILANVFDPCGALVAPRLTRTS